MEKGQGTCCRDDGNEYVFSGVDPQLYLKDMKKIVDVSRVHKNTNPCQAACMES